MALALSPAFWRSRRVFVTGNTGFKGSWISLWLHSLGAEVTGYSAGVPTTPSLFALANIGELVQSIEGDIRDGLEVRKALADSRSDVVVHMAAQSTVLRGHAEPRETYETNVLGTLNVLEAIRAVDTVRCALVITTDKCYLLDDLTRPRREGDSLGGDDPYSSSKACAELVVAAYRKSYLAGSVALATARAGNVIGGGDWTANRVVPDMIRAFGRHEAAGIRHPSHIRPWQHVLDPLHGYLMLIERLFEAGEPYAEAWNFGPSDAASASVAKVADTLVALWGSDARWAHIVSRGPAESPMLRLDSSKAAQRLGWHTKLALEAALSRTVDWYRAVADGAPARDMTMNDIASFMRLSVP